MHPIIICICLACSYTCGSCIGMHLHQRLHHKNRLLVCAVSFVLFGTSLTCAWILPSFALFCISALLLGLMLRTFYDPWL